MEHVPSGILLIMALPGILTIIFGFIVKGTASKYPSFGWGYKTDVTIKSAQAWSDANNFASKMYIIVGFANIILWPLATYIFWDGLESMIYMSCGTFLMLSIVVVIVFTEAHINKTFDRSGNPKIANS